MKNYLPIPSKIKDLMESGTLKQLDSYINPGISGTIFHNYSMEFLKVLSRANIFTFKELESEQRKVIEKRSNLSKRVRTIILGHYNYYMIELKKAQEHYSKLSPDQQISVNNQDYLITDNNEA